MNSIKQSTMVGSGLSPFLQLSRPFKYDKASFLEVAMHLQMVVCTCSILHNFKLKCVPLCLYLITEGCGVSAQQTPYAVHGKLLIVAQEKKTIVKTVQIFVRL